MPDTDEKIREWGGVKWYWPHNPDCECGAVDDDDSMRSWYDKEGKLATRCYNDPLPIDLNFLLKYAYPKLKETLPKLELMRFFGEWLTDILFRDKDPTEAFKQALIKVIDNGN